MTSSRGLDVHRTYTSGVIDDEASFTATSKVAVKE
jgi:hypothetical protein